MVIVDWRGDRDAPRCLSATHGSVIITSVAMNVEVNNLSTISNVVVHIIQHVSLDNGGECGHLTLSTRMPDHTTDEAFATRGHRIVINLCSGGVESHGVPCFDSVNIHGIGCLCHHSGQLEECHTNGGPMTQPTILFLTPLVTGVTL